MNRELKFKMWLTGTNTMTKPCSMEDLIDKTCFDEGVIYLQFTGLLDKNKKEIYEGDVIDLWPDQYKGNIAKIIFKDGGFQYEYLIKPQAPDTYEILFNPIRDCKVIGNIYQNPELLKL